MTTYADVTSGDIDKGVVNVIIEIRKNERNKYEFDKETGRLFLDRVNGTTLGYPADYGYIPGTLCEDGDQYHTEQLYHHVQSECCILKMTAKWMRN
jgi:inorganic pyrophosphatase